MTLRMRVLPRFPAKISGSTGIKITRPAGSTDLTVSLDVSDIVRVPSVADNNKVFFIAWNSDLDTYSIMSFADTFAAVVDTEGFMLQSVYDPQEIGDDAFDRGNHTGKQAISTITDLATALGLRLRVDAAQDFDATQRSQGMGNLGFSTFFKTLVDDADASAVLTTLGFSAFAKTIIDDASGSAMFSTMGATQSLGGSGYTKLPNGLIFQWGVAGVTGGNASINYPVSFPNAVFSVVASSFNPPSDASATLVAWAETATATSFNARARLVPSGGGAPSSVAILMSFIAIGW